MGIPGFFSYIKKDYNAVTLVKRPLGCDALYIDTGSILHTCLSMGKNEKDVTSLLLEYINVILNSCKPKRLLFIAFDGIPPIAKMKEQAQRRRNTSSVGLNSNIISPGTEFMANLTEDIQKPLHRLSIRLGIKTVISTSLVKGEGEHKIFNYMKDSPDLKTVVFGLDADLILLGLISPVRNLKILREQSKTRNDSIVKKKFEYVDINALRIELQEGYSIKSPRIIIDIVLTFIILGNDFLPSPKNTTIHYNLYQLLRCLKEFHNANKDTYLVQTDGMINLNSLNTFLDLIYECELESYKRDFSHTLQDELISGFSKLSFEENKDDKLHKKFADYRYDLYEKFDHKNADDVSNITKEYLQGLQWVMKYYLNGSNDEHFLFQHGFVPFLPDLKSIDKEEKKEIPKREVEMKPLHHLAFILPGSSVSLLPKPYRDHTFQLFNNDLISYEEIQKEVKKIYQDLDPQLSSEEQQRNKLQETVVHL